MSDETQDVFEHDARLRTWARSMSGDAQTVARMLPFGGEVRLRPSALEAPPEENPNNVAPAKSTLGWGMSTAQGGAFKDEDIEGFTVELKQLQSFFRASGAGRQESKDRVMAALAELTLRELVRVYQDESEEPRYALTEKGLKVQQALAEAQMLENLDDLAWRVAMLVSATATLMQDHHIIRVVKHLEPAIVEDEVRAALTICLENKWLDTAGYFSPAPYAFLRGATPVSLFRIASPYRYRLLPINYAIAMVLLRYPQIRAKYKECGACPRSVIHELAELAQKVLHDNFFARTVPAHEMCALIRRELENPW